MVIKKQRLRLHVVSASMASLALVGCGKKESDVDAAAGSAGGTPGVQTSADDSLALTGALVLGSPSLHLAGSNKGILAFEVVNGETFGDPVKVAVDAKGRFSHTVSKINDKEVLLQAIVDRGSINDDEIPKLAELFKATEEEVIGFRDNHPDELMGYLVEGLEKLKSGGGLQTILVSYDISEAGNKADEAQSFEFISMPVGDAGLTLMRNSLLKGNVNLGNVSKAAAAGGDALGQLDASAAFDMADEDLKFMASTDGVFKSIVNDYMNDAWRAEPFFVWHTASSSGHVFNDVFSSPDILSYSGMGFYVGSRSDTSFVYEELCHQTESSRTIVAFTPPSSVLVKSGDGSTAEVDAFSNAGSVQQQIQTNDGEDFRTCHGGGFYAREDDTNSFMLNFGTGGGVQGVVEPGLWRLTVSDAEVGRFDMSTSYPLDSAGKPTVAIPAIKVVKSGGSYTGVVAEMYRWDAETSAFVQLTDLSALRSILADLTLGMQGSGGDYGHGTPVTWGEDGTLSMTFSEPVASSSVQGAYVSYMIGTSTYRFEVRESN